MMMSVNLGNIAILKINNADYLCVITGISKSEVVHLLQKADFKEKRIKNLFLYIKMDREILTFVDIEIEIHKFHHYKNPFFKRCRH